MIMPSVDFLRACQKSFAYASYRGFMGGIILLAHRIGRRMFRRTSDFFQQRKEVWEILQKQNNTADTRPRIWLHVASLGEYEMIQPLLLALKKEFPYCARWISFFSPSGYVPRKNSPHADAICYLPLDRPKNMQRFFEEVKPLLGIIVKNELWPTMSIEATRNAVPLIGIGTQLSRAAIWQLWLCPFLPKLYKGFYLQDKKEAQWLQTHHNAIAVQQGGDMRCDSVLALRHQPAPYPNIASWAKKSPTIIWGSIWKSEWKILYPVIGALRRKYPKIQHLLAPHVLRERWLSDIVDTLQAERYTQRKQDTFSSAVLLLDTIGMLGRCYRFGDMAFIGGGKQGALHNILEPAVYGLPVVFFSHKNQPKRFAESVALRKKQGAVAVKSQKALLHTLQGWIEDAEARKRMGENAKQWVEAHAGATKKALALLRPYLSAQKVARHRS